MTRFTKSFQRESYGVWRCVTAATLHLPSGVRIDVAPETVLSSGTMFMGIDLAKMLEDQYQNPANE